MSMMKKGLGIVAVAVVFAIVGMVLMVNKLDNDAALILEEPIKEVSFDELEDGVYIGEYMEAMATNARVEVHIVSGRISKVILLAHENGRGEDAEVIIDHVIEEQSVMVDDVVGATYSSRVIKLAIMDALKVDSDE